MGINSSQQLYEVNGVQCTYSQFKKTVEADGGSVPHHVKPQYRGQGIEDCNGPIFNYQTTRSYTTGNGKITQY